jgi:nucleoside triphosphatase
MHADETRTEALERELEEELGLRVSHIEPAFFKDGFYRKLTPGGDLIPMYIIFLVFNCQAQAGRIHLNEEFSEYKWVKPEEVTSLDLNEVTHDTLIKAERLYRQTRGYLPSVGSEKHNLSRE